MLENFDLTPSLPNQGKKKTNKKKRKKAWEFVHTIPLYTGNSFVEFEMANQLLARHFLYLVPWINGNAFSFWIVNKVDFFLLERCFLFLINKIIHGCLEIWFHFQLDISCLMFNSISRYRVEHSKRNFTPPRAHVLFSLYIVIPLRCGIIPARSGIFRYHSCPFRFILASFCLVPEYSGLFWYIPFRSIPFLCLVRPIYLHNKLNSTRVSIGRYLRSIEGQTPKWRHI